MNTLAFTLGEHRAQLTLKISTYPNGNLAIKLYEKDHGILIFWETLTTNLTGIRPDHCAFINIKAADGLFPVWLSDNHLAEPTGQILESNGCLYPEYLFYGKELDALDHEGHTLYIRHQKGELGRRFERLYLALRRLAREINGFSYTDYSGWRRPDGVSTTLPLWIEASMCRQKSANSSSHRKVPHSRLSSAMPMVRKSSASTGVKRTWLPN